MIPKYPILYKTVKNKVSTWEISIKENDDAYDVITNKNKTVSKKTITKGTRNQTALEKAISVAEKNWTTTRKKYTEDLPVPVSATTRKKNPPIKQLMVEKAKVATSAFRPMLAQTFDPSMYDDEAGRKKKGFRLTFPVLVQRKLDGIRCIASMMDNKVRMFSRNGIEILHFLQIQEELAVLMSHVPHIYLDGELFTTKIKFEKINGIVRREKKDAETAGVMEYHIYDMYDPKNTALTFEERMNFITTLSNMNKNKYSKIQFVASDLARNVDEVKRFQQQYINEKYEGIMLREIKGPYEVGKRSKYLQKYKLFMEEEFVICGFKSGDGADKDCVIWQCKTDAGKTFFVRPQGTKEERKKLFKDGNSYIGRNLTVIFQEYTADLLPRFPVGKAVRLDGF